MTIAIGLLARDGIVIAADTQMTVGAEKFDKGKWSGVYCSDPRQDPDGKWHVHDPGSLIVSGAATPAGYLYNSSLALQRSFETKKSLQGEPLRQEFENVLKRFHKDHVVPFLQLPAEDRPVIELVIGYSRNNREYLLQNEHAVVNQVSFYVAAGYAKPTAYTMLGSFYRGGPMSLTATVLLASLVIARVKKSSIYAGNATDIVCIQNDAFWWARREWTKNAEELWEEYAQTTEAPTLRGLLGEKSRAEPARVRAFRKRVTQLMKDVQASQAKR